MSVWLYDFERRLMWERRRRIAIALLLALLAAFLLDRAAFHALAVAPYPEPPAADAPAGVVARYEADLAHFHRARATLEESDFYKTLRVAGSLWPWVFICGALVAQALALRPRRTALAGAAAMVLCSAIISGAAGEILRILFGRLRPTAAIPVATHDWFERSGSLGFPSTHAAVAFGAAFMLWFAFPRAGAVALLAAAGCGLTRMVAGAHFLSDVLAGALVGYATARLLRPGGWHGPRRGLYLP